MALFDRYKNRTNHAEAAPMTDDLFGGDVAVEEQAQVAVIEEAPAVALEDRDTEALPQDMEETEGEDHLISQEAESSDDGTSGNRPPPGDFQSIITSDGDGGDSAEALRFAERAYLEYAMSVVKGRALPSCQDGQKPVQRRILYAMRQMGLTDNAKPVKSARVVGDVLGKYHPHGDSSAYEAAVRLSQEFTMRYPLIDGQGNFGSRDGDNAAAMRYTEMRLTPISELLLSEIDQDTVDFMPNYDGAFKEPAMLPARLPVLLMNGSEGVAVGMATKIPPHNLAEVSEAAILAVKALPEVRCIKDENGQWVQEYDESSEFGSEQSNKPGRSLSFDKVMGIIQGPDFPEGGQVISSREDVLETYRTGRGSLRMRARWEIEQMARGQYRIAITELPYGEATTKIMSEIDALYNPQVKKGKKALDQDQINKKQKIQSMLDLIRNESGERVRIVIEPKTSKVDPQELMNFLLMNTSLETSFSVNMTMVGVDGKPTQKGIVDVLTEWAGFRFATVTRRTSFLYDKAMARIHILEGRRIAFLHIEEIIRVIREADDPKQELIDAFKLSEIQAEDILEIRLRQLARLEGIKIDNEIASLKAEADGLNELLGNPASMKASIVAQMRADIKKYGDDRRTLIEPVERVKVELTSMVADEPTTVILSKHGWIRSRQGHGLDLSNIGFKPGDNLLSVIETRTVNPLIFLDTKGRSYSVLASTIPGGKGDGVPITTLIDLQEQAKVSHMFSGGPEDRYLFAGDRGYGFIAPIAGLIARNKAGKAFMTLGDSESDSGATSLPPVAVTGETWLCARSSQNRMLVFKLDEMKELRNGGKGVMIMDIPDGEKLTQLSLHQDPLSIEVKGPRGKVNTLTGESLGKYILKRARKGAMI